jgi:hypothetical protein
MAASAAKIAAQGYSRTATNANAPDSAATIKNISFQSICPNFTSTTNRVDAKSPSS